MSGGSAGFSRARASCGMRMKACADRRESSRVVWGSAVEFAWERGTSDIAVGARPGD